MTDENGTSPRSERNETGQADGGRPHLTTRQGHPVYDNQNQRTVGDRGPATLENYHFLWEPSASSSFRGG